MTINSLTIPHKKQRYDTCGDWWYDKKGVLQIRVSDLHNPYYEAALSLHEQTEAILCKKHGVTDKVVCAFDIKYEKNRTLGNEEEPGDDPKAPYQNEHCMATAVERMLIGSLNIKWKTYEKAQNNVK